MIQLFNLLLTGLLSVAVFGIYKKYGSARACVMSMGFFVLGVYLDEIFVLIMQGFFDGGSELLMHLLSVASSKSIAVTGVLGVSVFVREQAEKNGSGKEGWKYLDGLTMGISLFFLLLLLFTKSGESAVSEKLFILLTFMILLGIYYVSMYLYLGKQKKEEKKAHEEKRKHELEVYLENVENNYQRTRELWHDLKNHINLMNLLMQDEKYEELKDYLRIFNEDVDSLTLPVKSGNLIVDALLADKLSRAKGNKIEVAIELCDMSGLKLKPDEICGLLGNLLDNSLEANCRLWEGRFLEITCKEVEDVYYIRVRNPIVSSGGKEVEQIPGCGRKVGRDKDGQAGNSQTTKGQVQRQEEKLRSVKTDLRNQVGHGLGLRSAERIVHGCGGDFVVDCGEKYFTVVVRLPRA